MRHIYTFCSSQPCRTMNDFILWGFNEAERSQDVGDEHGYGGGDHEMAFDGVLNSKAGGNGIFMNYRFSQPTRTHRQHIARWTPELQFPFANENLDDPLTDRTEGRLDRCERCNTCPKTMEVNSANEYWVKAGSMLTTDTTGQDLDLSQSGDVRYFLLASLPHGAGTTPGICAQCELVHMPESGRHGAQSMPAPLSGYSIGRGRDAHLIRRIRKMFARRDGRAQ